MNLEKVLIKYYEGREYILRAKVNGEVADFGPFEQHKFARFFAESDWDDPRAALKELHRLMPP